MADIAHTVPTSVAYLDGSNFGLTRPGIQVTPFASGRILSRDWTGRNLRQLDLSPALFESTADTLEEWETFWHQIDGGAACGYIVEPNSGTHRDLICGALADGTQTTFPLPALSPSSATVFDDGVPQGAAAYTLHSAANLLTDAHASCYDADDYTVSNGTVVDALGISLDGIGSIRVNPDGLADPTIRPSGLTSGFSASEEYTGIVACLCTNADSADYRVNIAWYESDDSYISTTVGSLVAITAADGWTVLSTTATSPDLTAKANVVLTTTDTTGTEPFYADCFALNPGDYTRWHLPSQCPGVIEFASAPSSGARITATATGKRVTRCRFEPGTRWSLSAVGHASARSIVATEWPEF